MFDGVPRKFSGTINLADLEFPSEAEVVLEATSAGSNVVERIPCGIVGHIHQPAGRALLEAEGENVFFTLKVIDNAEEIGRILGIAEQIRPEQAGQPTAGGRRGILPIEPADLGQELWRLEFKDQDAILFVNKDVPELKDRARSDPLFYAIAYPEVVRRVLNAAIERGQEFDDDDERWEALWLRFARGLHPAREEPPKAEDTELRVEWIEDVVEAFCNQHTFKDKFKTSLIDNDGDL